MTAQSENAGMLSAEELAQIQQRRSELLKFVTADWLDDDNIDTVIALINVDLPRLLQTVRALQQQVEHFRAHYEAAMLNWNEMIRERDESDAENNNLSTRLLACERLAQQMLDEWEYLDQKQARRKFNELLLHCLKGGR